MAAGREVPVPGRFPWGELAVGSEPRVTAWREAEPVRRHSDGLADRRERESSEEAGRREAGGEREAPAPSLRHLRPRGQQQLRGEGAGGSSKGCRRRSPARCPKGSTATYDPTAGSNREGAGQFPGESGAAPGGRFGERRHEKGCEPPVIGSEAVRESRRGTRTPLGGSLSQENGANRELRQSAGPRGDQSSSGGNRRCAPVQQPAGTPRRERRRSRSQEGPGRRTKKRHSKGPRRRGSAEEEQSSRRRFTIPPRQPGCRKEVVIEETRSGRFPFGSPR